MVHSGMKMWPCQEHKFDRGRRGECLLVHICLGRDRKTGYSVRL